jgi:hypothetical protein
MHTGLLLTAITIGFVHTLVGPDHYLPFIVIGRARRWGLGLTTALTFVCGLGHILSSVALGMLGAVLGHGLEKVMGWETGRGEWAGWALLIFGLAYCLWGIRHALKEGNHIHVHFHEDGTLHEHGHGHEPVALHNGVHGHPHARNEKAADEISHGAPASWKSLTPWVLFVIFVLGPCEPLIPLFFASAVAGDWREVAVVSLGYGLATLAAMHAIVTSLWFGLKRIPLGPMERWGNAMAGGVIFIAGVGMVFLGL